MARGGLCEAEQLISRISSRLAEEGPHPPAKPHRRVRPRGTNRNTDPGSSVRK